MLPGAFASKQVGCKICGDAFSIAVAYALESVLNAVGEEGLISAFKAVADFPRVCGAAGVLIWRDSLGRFGGEECRAGKDMTIDEHS
jgi:uncharacterized protein with ACT and thioredoxin-like domain